MQEQLLFNIEQIREEIQQIQTNINNDKKVCDGFEFEFIFLFRKSFNMNMISNELIFHLNNKTTLDVSLINVMKISIGLFNNIKNKFSNLKLN